MQILNISNRHWCVVSSNDCDPGHVKVYDTLYNEVQESLIPIIASLVFCTQPTLKISLMDVARQINSSDCGVLAIAIAYDLCAGDDPLAVDYDHSRTRAHLRESLIKCTFSRFPIKRARASTNVLTTTEVLIYCT